MDNATAQSHSHIDTRLDATHRTADMLHTLLRFKAWSDTELLKTLLALPEPMSDPEAGYVVAIIRHYHTVDCIFKAHLLGIPHGFSSPNPPEPSTLTELQTRLREVDDWYLDYTRNLDQRDLGEVLHVKFTDGDQQLLSRSDILTHVALHGAGHRGQVALLLQLKGLRPAPDRFTSFLRARSEQAT